MASFRMYDTFLVSSFIPAIFLVVLPLFYCTCETWNYLWTSMNGPLREQAQIRCLWIGGERERSNKFSNSFGDVINEWIPISKVYLRIKSLTLREKCPNTELFIFRIFLYLVRIQENTETEITPYLDNFHAV